MLKWLNIFSKKNEFYKYRANIISQMSEIKDWNKKTFRNATLEGQLMKLEEEYQEMIKAMGTSDYWKEKADVMIVLAGLQRFNSFIGHYMTISILDEMEQNRPEELKVLAEAMRTKMIKNRARKWHMCGNGLYHH